MKKLSLGLAAITLLLFPVCAAPPKPALEVVVLGFRRSAAIW